MSNEEELVHVAKLDINDVFWGMERVPASHVTERTVLCSEFGGGCDLPEGRYKWLRDKKQFIALEKAKRPLAPEAPTAERALYEQLRHLHENAEGVAPIALEWAVSYERSVDAGIGQDLGYFRDLLKLEK